MKKSILLSLVVSSLLTLGITGCEMPGGNNGESGGNQEKGTANFSVPEGYDPNQEVTINFYTTQGDSLKVVTQAFIDEFNKVYPNIHVEMPLDSMSYDGLRDQIKTELAINEGPDIAYCYPDHVALYAKKKVVAHLDNLISDPTYGLSQEQIDDFIPGYYQEGRQFGDGLMYTLPWSKSTEVMYYNKEFFANNNLAIPDHWFSNDENDVTSVEYACKVCLEKDPDCIPLGYDSADNWFITMCEQYNSPYTSADKNNHFLFDNEVNRGFVSKLKGFYDKGYVTTQSLYGSYTSALFTNNPTEQNPVRCYMCIGSSAGASHQVPEDVSTEEGNVLPFHVGIASIPQVDASRPRVISQGPSACIFNYGDANKTMAAWLFLKYMTTTVEYQASFAMASGYVPVLKSCANNEAYAAFLARSESNTKINAKEKPRVIALSAKQCLAQADAYFTSPAFYGSSTARTEVGNLLNAAISGSKTIDQAFQDALDECEYNS